MTGEVGSGGDLGQVGVGGDGSDGDHGQDRGHEDREHERRPGVHIFAELCLDEVAEANVVLINTIVSGLIFGYLHKPLEK